MIQWLAVKSFFSKSYEFIKKYWQFFLGVVVTIFGSILLTKKNKTGEVIKESTEAGVAALDEVIIANEIREEKIEKAQSNHEAEIAELRKIYEKKKDLIKVSVRKKIELSLENGRAEKATNYLAKSLNVRNLDKIDN